LISRNRHTFDRFDGLTDRLASLLGAFFIFPSGPGNPIP